MLERRWTPQRLGPRRMLSQVLDRWAVVWLPAALTALVLVPSAAAPARAASAGFTADGTVPADVRAAFKGNALRRGIRTPETDRLAEVHAGPVHQLFSYTADFVQGETTADEADPVELRQEWVAGVEGDGAPVGWLRVWTQDGGPATPTGWNPDPTSGAAMLATTASALVEVPQDAAFFTLVDGVATPVVVSEWDEGLGPRTLAQVQRDFAAERALYQGCDGDTCAGGGGGSSLSALGGGTVRTLTGAGVLVLVAAGLTVALRRRARPRSSGGTSEVT